jgi:hypothetical protein
MLPVQVYGADSGAVVAALVGAAAALLVAILGGVVTHLTTVRRAKAEVAAAKETARALLEGAERQAAATVEAAVEQAAGVREAGFRNAIETEAMRLRFRMAERHLDRFHKGASKLMAALREVAQTGGQEGKRFLQVRARSPYDPLMEAELVVRPEDWDRLTGTLTVLAQACTSVQYVITGGRGFVAPDAEMPPVWTAERYCELSRCSETAVAALQHITAVVGTSSFARAQGQPSAESLTLLSDLYLNWERRKALLKKTGQWGGRLVSDD